jgi:hypothetical protein
MKNYNQILFKGVVDKELNPFSIPSWCKEGNPEGSGRIMSDKRMGQFLTILTKGARIAEIKQTNFEKYPVFQAIRWEFAVVVGDKLITTEKWENELNNKLYVKQKL